MWTPQVSQHPSCQTVLVLHDCQLNCNHTGPCGSCSHACSSLTDQRACDDGSHGFHHELIGVSARLNLKAFDPSALYPIRVILCRQISPLTGFLPPVRGAASTVVCLRFLPQTVRADVLMDTNAAQERRNLLPQPAGCACGSDQT